MSLIDWRKEFSLGVPSVDHEHREMIELINRLFETLYQPGSAQASADFLGEIYARIAAHFALEERLMRAQGYDDYPAHKADHERLLDDLRDIMDHQEDTGFEPAELSRRMSDWFTTHFKTHDARLHHQLV